MKKLDELTKVEIEKLIIRYEMKSIIASGTKIGDKYFKIEMKLREKLKAM